MKKPLLAVVAVTALLLPGIASRASATEQPGRRFQFSEEDRAAFTNARIAALKAGLELTPAQEKNWPPVETALRDAMKARAARASEWRDRAEELREKHDVIEGLKLRSKGLSARGAELAKLADAAKPLFESLNDPQKRRFGVLLRVIFRPHGHHWRGGMRHD